MDFTLVMTAMVKVRLTADGQLLIHEAINNYLPVFKGTELPNTKELLSLVAGDVYEVPIWFLFNVFGGDLLHSPEEMSHWVIGDVLVKIPDKINRRVILSGV